MAVTTSCTPCCSTPQTTNIPGPVGGNGNDGTNGQSAYTVLTSQLTVPGDTVTPTTGQVLSSLSFVVGEYVIIGQGQGGALTNPGPNTFKITAIPSATSFTGTWAGVTGETGGGVISTGAVVSPVGNPFSIAKVSYVFNGTVTFTPQATTKFMQVECIGAGGSGGGSDGGANASAASGGGGGAYSTVFLSSISASYACAVGAGGVAPAAGANPGNAGGDTTFSSPSVCTAKGGSGGGAGAAAGTTNSVIAGGAGGAVGSGVGDVKIGGGAGRLGFRASATLAYGGGGGGAPSGGGCSVDTVAAGSGASGTNYGGGGAGGVAVGGSATTAGGVGGNGVIRVTEWS